MDRFTHLRLFEDDDSRITYYTVKPSTDNEVLQRLNNAITTALEEKSWKEDITSSTGWIATVKTRLLAIWLKRK